jgi:hypothetical protein
VKVLYDAGRYVSFAEAREAAGAVSGAAEIQSLARSAAIARTNRSSSTST